MTEDFIINKWASFSPTHSICKGEIMTFNPLKEKGIPVAKQLRNWHDVVKRPFDKHEVDCYSRTRQILMNGIEIESWNFKHQLARCTQDDELRRFLAFTKRIEDMQQTTVNWLTPACQSVLETTLGYEQVAVDLTSWLAQNEPDDYVRETYDFGLLEDFDHLYRYSQWAYMMHGISPDNILQNQTDVVIGRPTQYHHNCNAMRLRNHYDKNKTTPQTKVNILTLVSAEQQTHNFYAEHGMMYANDDLRRIYGEICDVEEEHVTMYESLIDPAETPLEKLLLHEFTEVCTYYNCYQDEIDEKLKLIWEEFLSYELGHLNEVAELFKKHENRDPEEIIGDKIILPCHFESQKAYVAKVLDCEVDKRLDGTEKRIYAKINELAKDWPSYEVQDTVNEKGAPSEQAIRLSMTSIGRDIALAEEKLVHKQPEHLKRGLEPLSQAPNTVSVEEYENFKNVPFVEF